MREVFRLNNISVMPGEVYHGFLRLANDTIELPVSVFYGKEEGKTMLITAGIHAGEYVGIEAAIELSMNLKIEKVSGIIIILKAVNRPAFERRTGSLGLTDGKNLNRVFPGNSQGSEMEKLASALSEEVIPVADYYIDLHSGDDFEQLTPYVYYAGKASEKVVEISREMAKQTDVPYMVRSGVSSGGAYNFAASTGIPSVLLERGGMGQWTREEVQSVRRDVRNILCYLGIYAGQKNYQKYYPMDVTDVVYQDASHNGCWYPAKRVGDMVKKGEILGEVRDYNGNILELCRAEYDGILLYQTISLQVIENGPMIAYGRIVYDSDDRKQRIVNYWEKRSEGFLVQRRRELHDSITDRWLNEVLPYLPDKKTLKILDVGCGTGYFTILLGKQGHYVTGIDLTVGMIENAKILAKEELQSDAEDKVVFKIMDAEKLEFSNENFDMVISRNLTWTLPNPETAYGEWMRVLKKGGVLINFDANYGDSDFTNTSIIPENHAHHMIGNDMMRECEEIKRQLPISSYARPAWDLDILSKLGVQQFMADLGVGRRIYQKIDEFYNPTPIFRLVIKKE